MEYTQHQHRSHTHHKKNKKGIVIHRKIHSSTYNPEIISNYCEDSRSQIIVHTCPSSNTIEKKIHSQLTDHHRFKRQKYAFSLPVNPIKQKHFGEVIEDVNKKRKHKRQQRLVYGLFCVLYCLLFLIGLVALLIALLAKPTVTTTTIISRFARFNVNMLFNGDAESGPWEMGTGVSSPTGWNYNDSITQTSYNNTAYPSQTYITPGPNDRGNCYFTGHMSTVTTMWQTINLNDYIDPFLIDNQTVKFNLSAWIGGWGNQNDNAVVSLFFQDQFNQTIDNGTSIGPVLAADRGSQTLLLFRQTSGLIPISTRFITILVKISVAVGPYNNGHVDNISVFLY